MRVIVRNARLLLAGSAGVSTRLDVAVGDATIEAAIEATIEAIGTGLRAASGDEEIDAGGGVLLRGLHDHHLHLLALAASRSSVDCSPEALGTDSRHAPAALRRAILAAAQRAPDAWVRGTGYFESVAGELDRARLDALLPELRDVPVRIQHRSGTAWFCNAAALRALGLHDGEHDPGAASASGGTVERDTDGRLTGRLFRLDAWLAPRVPRRPPDLAAIGRELASHGITSLTDATPFANAADAALLRDAVRSGAIAQRVHLMTAAPDNGVDAAVAVKLLIDERDPLDLDELTARITDAHDHGLPVAIHLTDRVTTWLALAAWNDAGVAAGDRIEHGAVLDDDAVERVLQLGIAVVTNPGLAAARGDDHARDTDPDDRPHLWRCGSLLDAGITVRAGSDAPYGTLDPWQVVRDSMQRRSRTGRPIGSDRRLQLHEALALFAPFRPDRSGASTLAPGVGDPADLCLLDGGGAVLDALLDRAGEVRVRLTMVGGRVIHQTLT